MRAQRARAGAASSAASSPPPTTSTPSSRPSPRARSASTACRCCARGRSPCRGSMPRVIRVLIHYYADEDHEPSARLPRRRAARCARTCRRRSRRATGPACRRHNRRMAIEFSERIRRIPVYPAAGGYAQQAPLVRLASNESPYPPLPAVREAIERALCDAQPLPRPDQLAAARALVRPLRRAGLADRDRQRLLRHPARGRRGAARARRRARVRVAVVLGLPAPRAPPPARAR